MVIKMLSSVIIYCFSVLSHLITSLLCGSFLQALKSNAYLSVISKYNYPSKNNTNRKTQGRDDMRFIKMLRFHKKETQNSPASNKELASQIPSHAQERSVFPTIEENVEFIKEVFGDGIGIVYKELSINKNKNRISLIYIESLTDKKIVSSQIIEPILKGDFLTHFNHADLPEVLKTSVIIAPKTRTAEKMKEVFSGLMRGSTIVFVNGTKKALIVESRAIQNRPIEKPETEATSLGSLDSLTEDIDTNCNLVSKRLPTPDLRIKRFSVGRLSQTEVKLLWIDGVVNSAAVEEAEKRIQKVDIDVLDGVGMLAGLIRDRPLSIFPTFKQTQRPDVIAKSLSDGQFVILCDSSPLGFIGPVSFWDHFKTMDDYSQNPIAASYLRLICYSSIALAVPSSVEKP